MSAVLPRARFLAVLLFAVMVVLLPVASAEERPLAMGINTITNNVFVVYNGSSFVAVFDGTTFVAEVSVGASPIALAVNPVTNKIYVANSGSDDVTVIDGSTYTTTTVSVGSWPQAVAVNPETNKIYVANNASASVTVIDGATNTTTTVSVGVSPQAVAVNPVTNKIYVADNSSNTITVIDGATNDTTTVSTAQYPYVVEVNPVTNKIYVGAGYGFMTVIDGATNGATTMKVAGDCMALAINPDSNKIYLVSGTTNKVAVIDGATNAITTVDVGAYPLSVGVNPVTNTAYVANYNGGNVTVIDGATNSTTTVGGGEIPYLVAVNPVTDKIYVANWDHYVTVIDGATASKPSPAAITSPAPGTQLAGSSGTFEWSAGFGITYYQLWIGTTEGSHDLMNVTIPAGTTSYTADNLPTTGQFLYVRLNSLVGGTYLYNSYTYTAAPPPTAKAAMIMPAPGSTLPGATVTFAWGGGLGVTNYYLWIGTSPGSNNLKNVTLGPSITSYTANNLPTTGTTLYVRLYSLINGAYQYNSYMYTTANQAKAAMINPADGSTLPGPAVTFTWGGGVGVTNYYLWIGTSPGSNNLKNATLGPGTTSYTANNLPTTGTTLYVRLYSLINGMYQYNSYTYTAANQAKAAMINPADGSTLLGPAVTFTWDGGVGVTSYYLWIGTSPGSNNLKNVALGPGTTSYTANNLPTTGATLYVRLYSLINGVYQYNSYTYTAANQAKAAMISPADGSTISATSTTFTWTPGAGVTTYYLWIGTTPGSNNVRNVTIPLGTTAYTATNLPAGTVYVRLYSVISGAYQYNGYTYNVASP